MARIKERNSIDEEENNNKNLFLIFCVESVANKLKLDGKTVYNLLAKDSDILNSYILACYDTLHTQSSKYIIEHVINMMKKEKVI